MTRCSVTALFIVTLLSCLQAQDYVLAWEHAGPVAYFRVTVNGATDVVAPEAVRVAPDQFATPLAVDGALRALVQACNVVGICADSEPLVVPVPAPPTHLRAQTIGMIGANIPQNPDPVGGGSAPILGSFSPADGSTDVSLTPTLSWDSSTADSYVLLFDTVNPPVAEIDMGAVETYSPPNLSYNTPYYWRVRATNGYGSTTSAVQTLTTLVDPGVPVDPDPTCASATTSPTGRNPVHWTACRQDVYDQMEADYEANPTTPATFGGELYKRNKALADATYAVGVTPYLDYGQFRAFIVQAKGCAATMPSGITYAAGALDNLTRNLNAALNFGFDTAPYDFVYVTGNNAKREVPLKVIAVLDTIKPCLSGADFDAANAKIASFIQSTLMHSYYHYLLSFIDSDNIVGTCFGAWVHYLLNPTMQAAIDNFTNVNTVDPAKGGKVGGFDPVTPSASFDPVATTATCRDAVQWYAEWLTPNAPSESGEYDLKTMTFWINGYDAVKTITGEDRFPEVATFLENYAASILTLWTPDLQQTRKWGDTEDPQGWQRVAFSVPIMELAGVLAGTTAGRKVHDLILDLRAEYGFGIFGGLDLSPHGSNPLFLYDPYDTAVEWRASTNYTDTALRYTTRKSHVTDTSASMLFVESGGPKQWNATLAKPLTIDHQTKVFGDWSLWGTHGDWAVTHPYDYGGPFVDGGDGGNVPLIHGFARASDTYNALSATHATDYSYVLMQQGGSRTHDGWCGVNVHPAPYLNEATRSLVFLPGATDIVVVYDRIDALETIPSYATCYSATDRARMEVFTQFGTKLIINHTYTAPTQNTNVFTSTGEGGEAVKMSFLFPSALTHTIINEATDTGYWSLWASKHAQHPEFKRYHVRTKYTTPAQYETYLSVHEVGTAGTLVALEDSGKVQGVHIDRASGNDAVVLFNSEQGSAITATYYSPNHQTEVPAQHFRETGFTISWAPTTANTLLILNDLNPANTWTYAIDGGSSTPITEDAKGHWSATIAASSGSAHTIVVTGS